MQRFGIAVLDVISQYKYRIKYHDNLPGQNGDWLQLVSRLYASLYVVTRFILGGAQLGTTRSTSSLSHLYMQRLCRHQSTIEAHVYMRVVLNDVAFGIKLSSESKCLDVILK